MSALQDLYRVSIFISLSLVGRLIHEIWTLVDICATLITSWCDVESRGTQVIKLGLAQSEDLVLATQSQKFTIQHHILVQKATVSHNQSGQHLCQTGPEAQRRSLVTDDLPPSEHFIYVTPIRQKLQSSTGQEGHLQEILHSQCKTCSEQ